MRIHRLCPALILALVVSAGPAAGEEGAAAAVPIEIEMLGVGAAPRRPLRLEPRAGTSQVLEATVDVHETVIFDGESQPADLNPAMRLSMDAIVDEVAENGDVTARFVYRKTDVANPTSLDPQTLRGIRRFLSMIEGTAIRTVQTSRSIILARTMVLNDYFPPVFEAKLQQMADQLDTMWFPLPEEAVGIGARWRVVEEDDVDGWTLRRAMTFEITAVDAESVHLDVVIETAADPQDLPPDPEDPSTSTRLLACPGGGRMTIVQFFAEVVPRRIEFALDMTLEMEMTAAGETEPFSGQVKIELSATAAAAVEAQDERAYDPPSAEAALAVVRSVQMHLRTGNLGAVNALVDHEAVLRGMYREYLDLLTKAERAELLALHEDHLADHIWSLPGLHRVLASGKVKLGEPAAEAPRGDYILVRSVLLLARGAEHSFGWILHETADGTRIVDISGPRGRATDNHYSSFDEVFLAGRTTPLSLLKQRLGLAGAPGSAEALPPDDGQPEWASPDALRLGIEPPVVPGAMPDRAVEEPHPSRIGIHLTANGDVHFRPDGRASALSVVRLGTGSPKEQEDALGAVAEMLDKTGGVPALVRADARVRWQYVSWIVQLCQDAGGEGSDVNIGVALPDGAHGVVELGRLIDANAARGADGTCLVVKLFRKSDDATKVKVGSNDEVFLPLAWMEDGRPGTHPAYDTALADLREILRGHVSRSEVSRGQVRAPRPYGPRVPHSDVVHVVHILRTLGLESLELERLPLPGETEEDE